MITILGTFSSLPVYLLFRKIFIGGIPPITSQGYFPTSSPIYLYSETIQRYFEQFGELCDCVLMQDKATGIEETM